MAQQWYTITADGVYGQRQYYTGDQIPMEWAVEWGLDGAALSDGEFFDAATKAALAAELADPASAARAQVEAAIALGNPVFIETYDPTDGASLAVAANTNYLLRGPRLHTDITITTLVCRLAAAAGNRIWSIGDRSSADDHLELTHDIPDRYGLRTSSATNTTLAYTALPATLPANTVLADYLDWDGVTVRGASCSWNRTDRTL